MGFIISYRGMICSNAKIQNLCEKPRGSFWPAPIISARAVRCRSVKRNIGILRATVQAARTGSKTRQRKMRDWHDHARALQAEIRRNNPTLKPDALATSILEKGEATVPAPEHETLTKFIGAEL